MMWSDASCPAGGNASGSTSGARLVRPGSSRGKPRTAGSPCYAPSTATPGTRSASAPRPRSSNAGSSGAATPAARKWRYGMPSSPTAMSAPDACLFPATRPLPSSRPYYGNSQRRPGITHRRSSGFCRLPSDTRRSRTGRTWRGSQSGPGSAGGPRSRREGGVERTTRRYTPFESLVKSCRSDSYYAMRTSASVAQKCIRCTSPEAESASVALIHRRSA